MKTTLRRVLAKIRHLASTAVLSNPAPIPFNARHSEYSVIASADDDVTVPDHLIRVALNAAERATSISMTDVKDRMRSPPYYVEVWPGEHYKLLAGFVAELRPKTVLEIGTSTGLSALAMLRSLPKDSRIVTFDILAWETFQDTCLKKEDFSDGRLAQMIGDVSNRTVMEQHVDLFRDADLIFVDGPKDGQFERLFIERLYEIQIRQQPLIIFDDIRVWKMLAIWRNIQEPKMDFTSLGHWSGTGLVHWTGTKQAPRPPVERWA